MLSLERRPGWKVCWFAAPGLPDVSGSLVVEELQRAGVAMDVVVGRKRRPRVFIRRRQATEVAPGVVVFVKGTKGGQALLGVQAPKWVVVVRAEVWQAMTVEQQQAALKLAAAHYPE